MSSSLGLYIEENLIKYAKVTKERDDIKVEAFGIKFYDQITDAIDQIVAETISYKIPISINLSEEAYNYFYFFNLLNKNDLKKSIETEFDSYCFEKGYNKNALETRYALVPDMQDKEKIKTIYMSANKAEINRRIQEFGTNSIGNISSLPMTISNIVDIKPKENAMIVNIENKTTVTTIIDEKIYNVDTIEEGSSIMLEKIKEKENSYSKAYEIFKNTTIYTMEGKELQETENVYLEDIMPTLYNIVDKVKELVENSLNKIDKIYITGTASVINNIDLYFQEYFKDVKCELLKPYFMPENSKINIKDYMEVNSAIALGLQMIGFGVKNINFKKENFSDKLPDWMKLEVGSGGRKTRKEPSKFNFLSKINFSWDWKKGFDNTEKWIMRTGTGVFALIIIYSAISMYLNSETQKKADEVSETKQDAQMQMGLIDKDIALLKDKTSSYDMMTQSLKDFNDQVTQNNKTKNVVPTLLSEIMYIIPQGVTVTSIENTGSHITINAQSEKYELLGYFKGKIITDGILSPSTVVSTSGVKQDTVVKIVIEGDLP